MLPPQLLFILARIRSALMAGIFFASLLWPSSTFAQVIIRENFVLDQRNQQLMADPYQTLTVTFSYSGSLRSTNMGGQPVQNDMQLRHGFCWSEPYVTSVTSGSGSLSGEISAGGYLLDLYLWPLGDGHGVVEFLADGEVKRHYEFDATEDPNGSSSDFHYTIGFAPPPNFWPADSTVWTCSDVQVMAERFFDNCFSGSVFDVDTDTAEVRITRGEDFGDLVTWDEQVGDSIRFRLFDTDYSPTLDKRYTFLFRVNSNALLSGSDTVVFEFQVRDIVKQTTIVVTPSPIHHLTLESIENSLKPGETSVFYVVARNASDAEITCLPDTLPITFTMDSTRFGHFIDTLGQPVNGPLTVYYRNARLGGVGYIADGDEPDTITPVGITVISLPGILPGTDTLRIDHRPPCLVWTLCPSKFSYGDTVSFIMNYRNYKGEDEPVPANQTFEVYLQNSNDLIFGKFLNPCTDSLRDYLTCTPQTFKFVASADTLPPEGYVIGFDISVVDTNTTPVCSCELGSNAAMLASNGSEESIRESMNLRLKARQRHEAASTFENQSCERQGATSARASIMLGETKYYEAKMCSITGSLYIEEKATDVKDADAISDISWSILANTPEDQKAVYYEYRNEQGESFELNPTKKGLIRLIGRYWRPGQTHRILLKAKDELTQKEATFLVEVTRPTQLGDTYHLAKDINGDDPINIDNLLIEMGGEYGIPPQWLKGQIERESVFESGFFWPVYRYEPWSDWNFRNKGKEANRNSYRSQPFWVNSEGMGDGDAIPLGHQNIKPGLSFPPPYPSTQVSIGQFVAANMTHYYNGNGLNKDFSNTKIRGPEILDVYWSDLVKFYRLKYPNMASQELEDSCDYWMKQIFQWTYTEYAQTRKAASYSYFQMIYTTAIVAGNGYGPPDDHKTPEELSDVSIVAPVVAKILINYADRKITETSGERLSDPTWSCGFEKAWQWAFTQYHTYSVPKELSYGTDVHNRSKNFLPK